MAASLVCWSCGESIESVDRPISRFAECKACRADLRVCKLCRFYARQFLGECSHDRAERVPIKDKANFCSHFRPRPDAFNANAADTQASQSALAALFGDAAASAKSATDAVAEERDKAQSQLDALFGLPPASPDGEGVDASLTDDGNLSPGVPNESIKHGDGHRNQGTEADE
ncbi:MAG: hypothetical protein K0U93_08590 [Gammaproteobacteria bacterium]|nr:hypothetical protein [Gammaproteobacteria bacterium]